MKFTQKMILHINGGGFSELHYDVYANGKKTAITHHERTNGSPEYRYVANEWHCGEETFDAMRTKGGLTKWLEAHAKKRKPRAKRKPSHTAAKEKE